MTIGHLWCLPGLILPVLLTRAWAADGSGSVTPRKGQVSQLADIPAGVQALTDIPYAKVADRTLLLDLYVPERTVPAGSRLPLLVWIFGGGWRAGNKRPCPIAGEAARGYIVASIEYRLSGEALFPAQVEDCKAAIRFLRANAAKYNIDARRVGVIGSSAGGHLAALLGTSGGIKDLEGTAGNLDQSSRVQAVVDFCGPSDLFSWVEYAGRLPAPAAPDDQQDPRFLIERAAREFLGELPAARKDLARKASPVTYVRGDNPPFLIIHGQKDNLVPLSQSQLLCNALKAAGVEVQLMIVPHAGHGRAGGEASLRAAGEFFDRHMKGGR